MRKSTAHDYDRHDHHHDHDDDVAPPLSEPAHAPADASPRIRRGRVRRPWHPLRWVGGIVLVFLALSIISLLFIDEPLRRYLERQMNGNLRGYTVAIHKAHFHPLGFAIDLQDWTVVQNAHPKPPVADFPKLTASVQWRELLFAKLVADFRFDSPRIHVNKQHLAAEAKDTVPVSDRGWQDALQSIYPLKINQFTVTDGELTYIDDDPKRPLTLKDIEFRAENIRNIHSRDRTYPSELHATATVFDTGKLKLDGNADFLAEPYAGVKGTLDIQGMKLDYFAPVVAEYNVAITKGTLSTQGELEYSPKMKTAVLRDVELKSLAVQYANRPNRDAAVKQAAEATKEAAKEVNNDPGVLLKIDRLRINDGNFAFVNEGQDPHYKLFVADTDVTLTNLSNQKKRGTATAKLSGKFMGSGETTLDSSFRPEENGPDFDVKLQIQNTDLRSMNDLLRAYGNFDVVKGEFGLTTELAVRNQHIEGYIKPFFRDLDVYDRRQDKDKNVFHQAYEGLVGGLGGLLENAPRAEVATKTDISGPVSSPKTNTLQILVNLVKNAFFKAILPKFDEDLAKHTDDTR